MQENIGKNKGVLLFVDDEKNILNTLKRTFVPLNYVVFTAESGEAGLDIISRNHIDLVVSDIRMPKMDGVRFLKLVTQRWPSIKKIILTGYASNYDILTDHYLSKPWNREELISLVNTMVTKAAN